MKNVILVNTKEKPSTLKLVNITNDKSANKIILFADVFCGRNGATILKEEGDGKTPLRNIQNGNSFWYTF